MNSAEHVSDAAAECTEEEIRKGTCMPEVTFTTFILSLTSTVMVQLGEIPDPDSGRTRTNLLAAKHTIDLLSMLKEKTTNNLTDEEQKLMRDLLYEARMHYVLKNK